MTQKDSSMSTTTEPNDLGLKIEWDGEAKNWMASGIVADGSRRAAIVTSADTIPELLRKVADRAEAMLREPTEAEKIDARRVHAIKWLLADVDALTVRGVVRSIRASDEAAGYVLVPTEGSGFEAMVRAAKRATVYRGDIYSPATVMVEDGIRAFLEAAKGDGRSGRC